MVNQHHIGLVFYVLFSENDDLRYNSGMCDEVEIFSAKYTNKEFCTVFIQRHTVQLLFDNRWTECYAMLNVETGNSKLKVVERTERDWLPISYNVQQPVTWLDVCQNVVKKFNLLTSFLAYLPHISHDREFLCINKAL